MNTDRYNWHRRPASGILTPNRFVEGQEVCIPLGGSFGQFKLEKKNRYGNVTGSVEFRNLITNKGLDDLGFGTNVSNCVAVGVGTAPPTATDTALQAQVYKASGSLSWTSNTASTGPSVASLESGSSTFPLGAINANLTEVGLVTSGGAVTSGAAGARALIVDGSGSPVAFPVSSDEQLTVTYTRGCYTIAAPIVTTQVISGVSHDVTIYPTYLNPRSGVSLASPYTLSGMSTDLTNAVPAWGPSQPGTGGVLSSSAYSAGNFYRDFSATWGAGSGTGSIYRCFLANATNFIACAVYAQPLVKGSGMLLTLPFRISWGRA